MSLHQTRRDKKDFARDEITRFVNEALKEGVRVKAHSLVGIRNILIGFGMNSSVDIVDLRNALGKLCYSPESPFCTDRPVLDWGPFETALRRGYSVTLRK